MDECIMGLAAVWANVTTAAVINMETPATMVSLRVIMRAFPLQNGGKSSADWSGGRGFIFYFLSRKSGYYLRLYGEMGCSP